ncbi:hypothetical protein OKW41_005129 [Paraburkholderia sp. UCT70]
MKVNIRCLLIGKTLPLSARKVQLAGRDGSDFQCMRPLSN